jgi:CDP-glucose 4,6-dehydratase
MGMTSDSGSFGAGFWRGKRVLLTGHTGFKGSWLGLWLARLGASVTGIGLPPVTTPNLFSLARLQEVCNSHFCDIREAEPLSKLIADANAEIVFHLAAQPLVRASYRDPLGTFASNVQGTAHVLEALRTSAATRVIVVVTTDKVYQNLEQTYPYRETDALGGHDPYSASKAAAEIVVASYRESYLKASGVAVASARAGNVIGGGDWSEDRLLPDAVRAWSANQPLLIRRPEAVRPWQHVLEPLAGYLRLAERLWQDPALAGAYNFGPNTHECATVQAVIQRAAAAFGSGQVVCEQADKGPHETQWLALEIAKARHVLGVEPRWALTEAIQRSMGWYRRQLDGVDARDLCMQDIDAYEACLTTVARA